MKTLQTLFVAILMVFSISAFTMDEPNTQKLSMDYALKTYVDAMTSGKVKAFAEILDGGVSLQKLAAIK